MKPHKILFFLLYVFAGIGLLMLVFPKDGIKINDEITLKFVSWNEFLNPIKNKDISDILDNNLVDEDTIVIIENTNLDSAFIDSVLVVYEPIMISVDSTLQQIEFPANNDTLLYNLYRNLTALKPKGGKIHILHYGDSQIEVDRMTDYFRMKLQTTFGGYGPGFHSGIQTFDFNLPMVVTYSDNWLRYKVFPKKDSVVTHKRFGITTTFSMFKAINDSSEIENTAWIQFDKSPIAYSNTKIYNEVRLYYGYNKSDVKVEISDGSNILYSDNLPANNRLQIKRWDIANSPQSLKFTFSGTSSPEIYGYSFESGSGVIVDNLPIRGSGGTFFGSMDLSLTGQIYASMNVKLILLQFGGNAIGGDSAAIRQYCSWYGNQMKYLKNIAPDAQIIVIGPADMSEKDKDTYVTRKILPYLIEQIRKTALANNCAFWNMYEAMGGENSMPSWVFHEPPLAEKDFIHFTPQGARIIAQMFYKALIYDYNKFVQKQNQTK